MFLFSFNKYWFPYVHNFESHIVRVSIRIKKTVFCNNTNILRTGRKIRTIIITLPPEKTIRINIQPLTIKRIQIYVVVGTRLFCYYFRCPIPTLTREFILAGKRTPSYK